MMKTMTPAESRYVKMSDVCRACWRTYSPRGAKALPAPKVLDSPSVPSTNGIPGLRSQYMHVGEP